MPDVKRVRTDNEVITVTLTPQEVDVALREWALRQAGFEQALDHVKAELLPLNPAPAAPPPWQQPQAPAMPGAAAYAALPSDGSRTVRITVDFLKAPKQVRDVWDTPG